MSGGFGVPNLNLYGVLGGIADDYVKQSERQRKLDLLKGVGSALQTGDYAGAASMALDAGDAETGIGLLKLGQAAEKEKRIAGNDARIGSFLSGLGPDGSGGYGGDAGSGPQTPLGFRSDRSMPSFTSSDGAIGSYLAGTRAKESGGNDLAQNPNSTAKGRYQFTDETWAGVSRDNPQLGLTPGGWRDPVQQEKAMEAFTNSNARKLTEAGIPINPGNLYGSHFLGSGGFRRFFFGTSRNPDAPAVNYVSPGAASANKSVFFNKDGSPKRAAEVLDWMGRGYGGGAPATRTASRPSLQPEFAETEADVQRLERQMGMVPADDSMSTASLDPRADMPVEGAVPTIAQAPGFGAPPVPSRSFQRAAPPSLDENARNFPTTTGDLPPSVNNVEGGVLAGARGAPPAPGLDVPTLGGPTPDRVMRMPGDPVQVAQGPDLSTPDGRREEAQVRQVQAVRGLPSGQRISKLLALSTMEMSEGPRAAVQTMLKQALDESKLPDSVKSFMIARANGWTKASNPAEYEREMKGPQTIAPGSSVLSPDGRSIALTAPDRAQENKVAADQAAREAGAARYGLKPGDPGYQTFVLTGKMPREDQQPLTASDKKAILEADDGVASAETAIGNLNAAKTLSAKAYEGPTAGVRGSITGYFGNEAGQATQELDNLITTNALGQLKAIFGAAPTEGERKILLEIQGSSNLPHALRVKIYDRAIELANRRLEMNRQRASELRGGTYFREGGGSPDARGGGNRGAGASGPPAGAIDMLRANPGLADQFNQKYGAGAAERVFGGY